MNNKLVSIIVLSYKNLQYINETIDSILYQDYENIELIIGDDGTNQFNIEFYKNYIDKIKFKNIKNVVIYTNEKNLGTVKNANKAINLSKGEYIKFIAADDVLNKENVISKMVAQMNKNHSMILTTNVLWCDEKMNELKMAPKVISGYQTILNILTNPQLSYRKLAQSNDIPALGVMLKREVFEKYGLFDEEYILMEDWPMWLKLSRYKINFDYLDIVSAKYRIGTGISTSTNPNPIFIEDCKKCMEKEILPYKKELGYWLHKNLKYLYTRKYKFEKISNNKKILFILSNIDVVFVNQLKKIKLILRRNIINEN